MYITARNYRLTETETRQIFSRMFVMAKIVKELFASTLDKKPISVKCVSFMIVVLNAKYALLFAVHANKKYGENRRSPTTIPRFAS